MGCREEEGERAWQGPGSLLSTHGAFSNGGGAAAAVIAAKSKGPGPSPDGQAALQSLELAVVSLKTCLLALWLSEERVVCPLSIS